jgi:ribosome-associated toxin RatA of RatAB toxin-antitoxin module
VSETLDPASLSRLGRGEVLVAEEVVAGAPTPRLVTRGVIEAPPERVWALLDRCDGYVRFMPRVAESRELSRTTDAEGRDEVISQVTIDMPFPLRNLTAKTRAVHTVAPGERYERAWELVEGDYLRNSGSWVLVPFPGAPQRTLATYRLLVVPKTRLPKKIQSLAQSRTLPQVIEALRGAV